MNPSGQKGVFGKIINLTIGDIISEQGFLTQCNMAVDTISPWEIDDKSQAAYICGFDFTFKVVQTSAKSHYNNILAPTLITAAAKTNSNTAAQSNTTLPGVTITSTQQKKNIVQPILPIKTAKGQTSNTTTNPAFTTPVPQMKGVADMKQLGS